MDTLPAGFLEVDLESFFERLLSSVFNDNVSAIATHLQHKSEVGAFANRRQPSPASIVRGRWRWYPEDPKDIAGDEDTVFAHFNDIRSHYSGGAGGSSTRATYRIIRPATNFPRQQRKQKEASRSLRL